MTSACSACYESRSAVHAASVPAHTAVSWHDMSQLMDCNHDKPPPLKIAISWKFNIVLPLQPQLQQYDTQLHTLVAINCKHVLHWLTTALNCKNVLQWLTIVKMVVSRLNALLSAQQPLDGPAAKFMAEQFHVSVQYCCMATVVYVHRVAHYGTLCCNV